MKRQLIQEESTRQRQVPVLCPYPENHELNLDPYSNLLTLHNVGNFGIILKCVDMLNLVRTLVPLSVYMYSFTPVSQYLCNIVWVEANNVHVLNNTNTCDSVHMFSCFKERNLLKPTALAVRLIRYSNRTHYGILFTRLLTAMVPSLVDKENGILKIREVLTYFPHLDEAQVICTLVWSGQCSDSSLFTGL